MCNPLPETDRFTPSNLPRALNSTKSSSFAQKFGVSQSRPYSLVCSVIDDLNPFLRNNFAFSLDSSTNFNPIDSKASAAFNVHLSVFLPRQTSLLRFDKLRFHKLCQQPLKQFLRHLFSEPKDCGSPKYDDRCIFCFLDFIKKKGATVQ